MYQQKGFIHLLPLFLIFFVGIVVAVVLVSGGIVKFPSSLKNFTTIITTKKAETPVEVKTEYKNPFAKESQYVNPFDQYKSPFLSLKQK